MEHAVYANGALPREQRELIAVGTSVVKDCESGMRLHIEHAVTAGATSEEVFGAVGAAIEMGGGRATVSARFALDVMDTLKLAAADAGDCGCPAQRSDDRVPVAQL
jgi:AhpD family alkylhydroperoxidase